MSPTSRKWSEFAQDAFERAVKTFAQTVVASLTALSASLDQNPAELTTDRYVWAAGLLGALLSVLTSVASRYTGSKDSARFRG